MYININVFPIKAPITKSILAVPNPAIVKRFIANAVDNVNNTNKNIQQFKYICFFLSISILVNKTVTKNTNINAYLGKVPIEYFNIGHIDLNIRVIIRPIFFIPPILVD